MSAFRCQSFRFLFVGMNADQLNRPAVQHRMPALSIHKFDMSQYCLDFVSQLAP